MKVKDVAVDGKVVRLSIWDTAGQERYQSITQQFYRNAHAIIYGELCASVHPCRLRL
jgi:GTPase SAR1 family protein